MNFIRVGNFFIKQDCIISIEPKRNAMAQYNAVVTYRCGTAVKSAKSKISFKYPDEVMEWIEKVLLVKFTDTIVSPRSCVTFIN